MIGIAVAANMTDGPFHLLSYVFPHCGKIPLFVVVVAAAAAAADNDAYRVMSLRQTVYLVRFVDLQVTSAVPNYFDPIGSPGNIALNHNVAFQNHGATR